MSDAMVILQNKLTGPEVRQVLLELNHPGLLEQYEIQQQITFALNLLNRKAPVRELADRLRRRFVIGKSTAYRRIDAALSHCTRYGGKGLIYSGPILLRVNDMHIPSKQTRKALVGLSLAAAGLKQDKAIRVAALVPDVIVFHAVFMTGQPLTVELVNDRSVYLNYQDKDYFLGRVHDDFVVATAAPWRDLQVMMLNDTETADIDLASLLSKYDPDHWTTAHGHLEEAIAERGRKPLDCVSDMRGFAESAQ